MDAMEKLQAGQKLAEQVNYLGKQIEIVKKVIANALEQTGEYPVLAMRLEPAGSATMPLVSGYVPVDRKSFYDSYVKNMQENKAGLESQLADLFLISLINQS